MHVPTASSARSAGLATLSIVVLCVLSGCVAPPSSPSAAAFAASPTPPPTAVAPSPVATTTPTATQPPLHRDLDERPQIWFSPLDPSEPDASRPFNGGPDFMQLFEEDAAWARAAEAVHVFKLYGGWVAGHATDEELRRVVDDLNRRGMAIGFEASPLRYGSDCAAWIDEGTVIMRRLAEAGAIVRFVALDHPYDSGVLSDAPDACHLPVEEAAAGVASYVRAIRDRLPDAAIGTIETAANERVEVERWVEAYRATSGEDFDFVHMDLNFARPDWPEATLEIEGYLRDRGIDFGMIYFGNWEDRSDAVWLGRVEERFTAYELLGGHPDHAIFQSWHPSPQRLLPETDSSAFTAIINRYVRQRTILDLEIEAGASAMGTLTTIGGVPLTSEDVVLAAVPASGPGIWHEYTITGTVPATAALADVGYRVNTECACAGSADFTLASVHYVESGADSHIPAASLATGAVDWGVWGTAPHSVDGDGLHVSALSGQDAAANSPRFGVTPGATYAATFVARVATDSLGSGYFSIIFNDGQTELTRQLIPLRPAVVQLGVATTDGAGRYALAIDLEGLGHVRVRASFAGGATEWPTRTEVSP